MTYAVGHGTPNAGAGFSNTGQRRHMNAGHIP